MPDITSRKHALVGVFKSAARGDDDDVLLDGWHLLHDAVAAGLELRVVAIAGRPPSLREATLIDDIARRSDVVTVTSAVMDAMSPVQSPSGVVAIAARPQYRLADLLVTAPPLLVVLVDVQDPGNAGAIVRSAEAGGCHGVVFGGRSADPWGWKALRAAMGSTFRMPLIRRPDTLPLLHELRASGIRLVATVPHDGQSMYDIDFTSPTALLIGAEGSGLDDSLINVADARVSVPMNRPVESLNAAVATALLVYEARRQRRA